MTDIPRGGIWDLPDWLQTMSHLERPEGWTRPPAGWCVAPLCEDRAAATFIADAPGRLAGRDWLPGDPIELCAPHAADIYASIGKTYPDEVAYWLRPDAADPPNTWTGARNRDPWSPW